MVPRALGAALLGAVVVVAGCGDAGPAAPDTTPPATTAPGATTTAPDTTVPGTTAPDTTVPGTTAPGTAAPDPPVVDWEDPARTVDLGGGWTIGACLGDAPLLCVDRDGVPVGGVEAAAYDVASISVLDPNAPDAANLQALAAEVFATVDADRRVGCGDDYVLEPIESAPIRLGDHGGVAYGFTGTRPDGQPSELFLQYSAIDGDRVISITAAAYDEGGCPGRDDLSTWNSESLMAFRPLLEAVLRATPLPVIG